MESVIDFSHSLLKSHITKDDVVIDMTVGNGNDTLVLASIARKVYGFDIQKDACTKTSEGLKDFNNYRIINDSHLNFEKYVKEDFCGVIFNLGYLPKGD